MKQIMKENGQHMEQKEKKTCLMNGKREQEHFQKRNEQVMKGKREYIEQKQNKKQK